jgi:REP element-mobilizing transposase RayT
MRKRRRVPRQLELPRSATWGGARKGAGRKRQLARPEPAHAPRPEHQPRHPVHATLRARPLQESLRSDGLFTALSQALSASGHEGFRLIHFSVQTDHLHLIVEADSTDALARGLHGLAVRCAKAINRALGRRGPVWHGRYHIHRLATPSEVRLGLVYVLLNHRKHLRAAPGVDPCSSGAWFDGWARALPSPPALAPVVRPGTWMAAVGWRRAGGPIDWRERPRQLPAPDVSASCRR